MAEDTVFVLYLKQVESKKLPWKCCGTVQGKEHRVKDHLVTTQALES